jgi:hypothetical protein
LQNVPCLTPRAPHLPPALPSALQLLLIAKGDDLKPDAKMFKAFRSVAVASKGKFVFVTVDTTGESKDPVLNYFGIKPEDAPVLVGFHMSANKKYRLKKDIT